PFIRCSVPLSYILKIVNSYKYRDSGSAHAYTILALSYDLFVFFGHFRLENIFQYSFPNQRKSCIFVTNSGEVSEWLKEQTWKVCIRDDRIEGSNPSLYARLIKALLLRGFFVFRLLGNPSFLSTIP